MSDRRPWAEAEYVRLYYTLPDRMGPAWYDPHQLSAYVRLLMQADASYPLAAPIPRWLDDAILAALVARDLVHVEGPSEAPSYRIGGLDRERAERGRGRAIGGHARAGQADRDDHGRFLPGPPDAPPAGPDDPAPPSGDEPASVPASAPASASIASTSTSTAAPASTSSPARDRDRDRDLDLDRVPRAGARAGRGSADPGTDPGTDGWSSVGFRGERMAPFRAAWSARFARPPSGSTDASDSQAGLLWRIADDCPSLIGGWVRDAPPRARASEVVGYVLRQYKARAEPGPDDRPAGPGRAEAAAILTDFATRVPRPGTVRPDPPPTAGGGEAIPYDRLRDADRLTMIRELLTEIGAPSGRGPLTAVRHLIGRYTAAAVFDALRRSAGTPDPIAAARALLAAPAPSPALTAEAIRARLRGDA